MQTGQVIRVAVVEDNAGVREQWVKLLHTSPGFQCVGACDRGETALRQIPQWLPDLVLMDISLPGMSGIECTVRLHQTIPGLKILVVTVYSDSSQGFRALQAGASGYLLKRVGGEQLLRSIVEVMEGGAPMTGEIARKVIETFRRPQPAVGSDAQLSPREEEVLSWVSHGYSNKEIGAQLGISVHTVGVHLANIYGKLHVRSRTEAAAWYFSGGQPGPQKPPLKS